MRAGTSVRGGKGRITGSAVRRTGDSDRQARSADGPLGLNMRPVPRTKACRRRWFPILFDYYYGGGRNEVFLRKGASIVADDDHRRFAFNNNGQQFVIESSVLGVFLTMEKSMKRAAQDGYGRFVQTPGCRASKSPATTAQ